MTKKEQIAAEKSEAVARLREWFPVGSTVYTILRHVSKSGMRREIGIVAILPDGTTRHPNHATATALGYTLGKSDSVKVDGCGMDMGYHIAYGISAAVHGDGYALKHSWL